MSMRWGALSGVLAMTVTSAAVLAADFKGKTIEVVVGSASGGGTDTTARLIVPYIQKHLPGNPVMVIRNMPGAEGVTALNYVVQQTKPEGLTLIVGSNSQLSPVTYKGANGRYDPRKLRYIGGVGRGGSVVIANRAREQRLYDRSAQPVFFGTLNGLRAGELTVFWAMEFLGWNVKPVIGYHGTNDVVLAMDRDEVDVSATSNLFQFERLLKTDRFAVVLQSGSFSGGTFSGRPELGNTPVLMHAVADKFSDPVGKQAFLYWQAYLSVDKWLGLTEGTSDDILAAYRTAFDLAMADPAFVSGGAKMSEDLAATAPQDLEYLVNQLAGVTPEAVEYIKAMQRRNGVDVQ